MWIVGNSLFIQTIFSQFSCFTSHLDADMNVAGKIFTKMSHFKEGEKEHTDVIPTESDKSIAKFLLWVLRELNWMKSESVIETLQINSFQSLNFPLDIFKYHRINCLFCAQNRVCVVKIKGSHMHKCERDTSWNRKGIPQVYLSFK